MATIIVKCSGCGAEIDGESRFASVARWNAKQKGWTTTAKHEFDIHADDFCPKCTEKMKKE